MVVRASRRRKTVKKVFIAGLALVTASAIVAGIALASIPDAAGVIHACYGNQFGILRVIDTAKGQSCRKGETALDWNQQGPPGPQGVAGPQGPQGAPGISGYEVVVDRETLFNIVAEDIAAAQAACPQGKTVLGGGANTLQGAELSLKTSGPTVPGAWRVEYVNTSGKMLFQADVWAFAICAYVAP
jgi:hypothetical protein